VKAEADRLKHGRENVVFAEAKQAKNFGTIESPNEPKGPRPKRPLLRQGPKGLVS